MKDIKLFIDNKLVDFSDELSMPLTYQLEELTDPTIVKNLFSKTITIVGTKNNNIIFGDIYNVDRKQEYNIGDITGAYYDPSKRTPFEIYRNGELIESGYMQLNDVVVKNKIINYNITLYGGLGDFFYNLMYDDNGEEKHLSDLRYFVEDVAGTVLPSETEMDFNITKEFVHRAFQTPLMENNSINGFITFIPSYNGLYENFDNEKVLINAQQSIIFRDTYKEVDGTAYEAYNGYALAELNKSYTEWEMRDLRSYMQRPAIRLKQLFNTLCRPENNGGYEVVLDDNFFNESNDYWEKTFVALPLLNTIVESDEESYGTYIQPHPTTSYELPNNGNPYYSSPLQVSATTEIVFDGNEKIINLEALGDGFKKLDFSVNYGLNFVPSTIGRTFEKYYIGYWQILTSGTGYYGRKAVKQYIDVWVTITDQNDNLLWTSKVNRHTTDNGNFQVTTPTGNNSIGWFQKLDDGQYYWVNSGTTNNAFVIDCEDVTVNTNLIKIKLNTNFDNCTLVDGSIVVAENHNYQILDLTDSTRGSINTIIPNSAIEFTKMEGVLSNTYITKDKLLKSQYTPADYLLSYAKMFGLYFTKDIHSKTIYIRSRNNFFTGEIEDWSDRIDYEKDFKIEPLVFDKKFYRMKFETPETYYSKKYNTEYKLDYGQQRIDTNYNFNNETKDIFEDNIYENVVTTRDYSQYFRTFKNKDNREVPGWLADGCTYKLFNFQNDVINAETEIDYRGGDWIDLSKTTNWWTNGGYDIFPKVCCYESDKDEKNLSDINNSLLFFNGQVPLKNMNGEIVSYWITDNVKEMYTLNDEPCWLYTETHLSPLGETIAIQCTELPQFTRMAITGNYVDSALDFGQPRELYVKELNYDEDKTLYARYWKDFLADQYNINTKKVTAYVKLDDLFVNNETMRKFYSFGNAIWMLNKIVDYDINNTNTVKCEFIKINDVANYTQGQFTTNRFIEVIPSYANLDYSGGTYTFKVNSSNPWSVLSYSNNKISSISTLSGAAGETDVVIEYTENTGNSIDNFYVSVVMNGTVDSTSIRFEQQPNADTTIVVSGIITNSNNGLTVNGARVLAYDQLTGGNYINVAYTNENGYYEINAAKNEQYYIEVQYDIEYGDDMVYQELQPASATDVTLNISVDITNVSTGTTASGTYYFVLEGAVASTDNEHLLTNGQVESDSTPQSFGYNIMYCNEGIVEDMVSDGLLVNDVNTYGTTVVPIGGQVYWYYYDTFSMNWTLIDIITVENLNGGERTYRESI